MQAAPGFGRVVGAAAIAAALLGAAAPTASAMVVQSDSNGSLFVGGDDEADHLLVTYDPGAKKILFTEPGITETGAACTRGGNEVACTLPALPANVFPAGVGISLGNGNNSVVVSPSVPASLHMGFRAGNGADSIFAGPGNDTIDPGPGPDIVSGGAGSDQIIYGQRVTPVEVALNGAPTSGNELDGPAGSRDTLMPDVENIFGGNAPDRLIGNSGPNTIEGFKGDDILVGLGGDDQLEGDDHADHV